jgi:large subunit ribosomal protein L27
MGRDHTIYAVSPGFVRFYTEQWMSKPRRFVGLVLNRGEKLPRDEASFGRSRFFGLVDLNAFQKHEEQLKVVEKDRRELGY